MNPKPALAKNISKYLSAKLIFVLSFFLHMQPVSVAPSNSKYITVEKRSILFPSLMMNLLSRCHISELCRRCIELLLEIRSARPLVKFSGIWNVVVSGNQLTVGQSGVSHLILCREYNSESPLESRLLLFALFFMEERSLFNLK